MLVISADKDHVTDFLLSWVPPYLWDNGQIPDNNGDAWQIYAKPNNILQFGDIKPKQADYNSPLIAVY